MKYAFQNIMDRFRLIGVGRQGGIGGGKCRQEFSDFVDLTTFSSNARIFYVFFRVFFRLGYVRVKSVYSTMARNRKK